MSTVKNIIMSSLVSVAFIASIASANTTTTTTEQTVKHTKKTHHHHAVKSRHHEHHTKSESKSKSEDSTNDTAPVPGNAQPAAAKADASLTKDAQIK